MARVKYAEASAAGATIKTIEDATVVVKGCIVAFALTHSTTASCILKHKDATGKVLWRGRTPGADVGDPTDRDDLGQHYLEAPDGVYVDTLSAGIVSIRYIA